MSNLSDRGTLRGTLSVGSESGGTDNYNNLINKPSINGHELVGNQSGDNLELINNDDLAFNVGHAGNILHNIKYKNNTYTTYAEPYRGASSSSNGTMGLVPAPLASQGDYDKFLKGNGRWATIGGYSEAVLYDNAGTAQPASMILSDDIFNYNLIMFEAYVNADDRIYMMSNIFRASAIISGWNTTLLRWSPSDQFINIGYVNSREITCYAGHNMYIKHIVGLKF